MPESCTAKWAVSASGHLVAIWLHTFFLMREWRARVDSLRLAAAEHTTAGAKTRPTTAAQHVSLGCRAWQCIPAYLASQTASKAHGLAACCVCLLFDCDLSMIRQYGCRCSAFIATYLVPLHNLVGTGAAAVWARCYAGTALELPAQHSL